MSEKNKLMKLCFKAGAMKMAIDFQKDKKLLDGIDLLSLEAELDSLREIIHPLVEDESIILDAIQNKNNPNSYEVE